MRFQVVPGVFPAIASSTANEPFTILNLPLPSDIDEQWCDERYIGKAYLPPTFTRNIMEFMGILPASDPRGNFVATMQMLTSTPRHKDHVSWEGGAAFIFMNSNPDAYFDYGDTSIPVVQGSLISFDGSVP